MRYEWILLYRQKLIMLASLICLLSVSLGLWNGHRLTQSIHTTIDQALLDQESRRQDEVLTYANGGSPGDSGYYVYHLVYDRPSGWNFLSLGNRPYTAQLQRIRLLGLESQIYDGESHNPEYAVAGHFDYAFAVVFLLPLLCIALAHNLGPVEHRAGRMALLQTLAASMNVLWIRRLLLRWWLATLTFVLPLLLWVAWANLPWLPFFWVVLWVGAYALFWVLLSGLLSLRSSQPSANANAMLSMMLWLLLTIVVPTAAGFWISASNPTITGAEIALSHRKFVHDAWDLPKEDTFKPFFEAYPEWKDTPPVQGRFHSKWYYAFQHVADMRLQPQVEIRERALLARDHYSRMLGWIVPSVSLQYALDDLAQNNLQQRLQYRQHVRNFHTSLRHYYYPYLFEERPFNPDDFLGLPRFTERQSDN